MQNTQSYAARLHNRKPSFLNTYVARPPVKRKICMADNRCGWSIVHLKKESNESIFLPEELGNTKADRWSSKRLHYRGETHIDNTTQEM
ncbi:hypothetical protein TNCV_260331 [Trichonephila clavipes]|nr:hypothetical protein TNCV_260331 [Trichonephila clavipes]